MVDPVAGAPPLAPPQARNAFYACPEPSRFDWHELGETEPTWVVAYDHALGLIHRLPGTALDVFRLLASLSPGSTLSAEAIWQQLAGPEAATPEEHGLLESVLQALLQAQMLQVVPIVQHSNDAHAPSGAQTR